MDEFEGGDGKEMNLEKKCRCGHSVSEHSEDGCFHGAKEGSYRSFDACDCELFEEDG